MIEIRINGKTIVVRGDFSKREKLRRSLVAIGFEVYGIWGGFEIPCLGLDTSSQIQVVKWLMEQSYNKKTVIHKEEGKDPDILVVGALGGSG